MVADKQWHLTPHVRHVTHVVFFPTVRLLLDWTHGSTVGGTSIWEWSSEGERGGSHAQKTQAHRQTLSPHNPTARLPRACTPTPAGWHIPQARGSATPGTTRSRIALLWNAAPCCRADVHFGPPACCPQARRCSSPGGSGTPTLPSQKTPAAPEARCHHTLRVQL